MTCPQCKKDVDVYMAVFWNGTHWHRSCAVMFQKKEIVKIEKKLRSSAITQIQHAEQTNVLKDALIDLNCLNEIVDAENTDHQNLGKIMVRRGFGKRVDTNRLIESGELTHKQLEKAKEIRKLYDGDS